MLRTNDAVSAVIAMYVWLHLWSGAGELCRRYPVEVCLTVREVGGREDGER